MRILVSGAAGFICGYLIEELLRANYEVIGLDNYAKYGPLKKSYDDHPRYKFIQGDYPNARSYRRVKWRRQR